MDSRPSNRPQPEQEDPMAHAVVTSTLQPQGSGATVHSDTGVNIVQWLARKAELGSLSVAAAAEMQEPKKGAVEWFNSLKEKGTTKTSRQSPQPISVPLPRSAKAPPEPSANDPRNQVEQPRLAGHHDERLPSYAEVSTVSASASDPVRWLSEKFPQKNSSSISSAAKTGSPQPPPAILTPVPVSIQYPVAVHQNAFHTQPLAEGAPQAFIAVPVAVQPQPIRLPFDSAQLPAAGLEGRATQQVMVAQPVQLQPVELVDVQQQELAHKQATLNRQLTERLRNQDNVNVERYQQERIDIAQIMKLIEQHEVTFICTDTGSGKSTLVPKAILEMGPNTRIVSTQPRRTATVNIATRVANLHGEHAAGEDVGYWIRGEKKGDEQTRLWYMTSYTLLLYLLNNPLRPPFTHIILDEFHERQPDIEVTVALLRLCLKHHTANFKLVLMSATLNTDEWVGYFDGLSVATYKQSEPEHPIHDYFVDDACAMMGIPYQPPPTQGTLQVDHGLMDSMTMIAQYLIRFLNAVSLPQHSILVFLPGRGQVESCAMWLNNTLRHRVEAIPWHSAVELSVIQEAIQRKGGRKQKVYLATDIAEVSITLPDVVFVIDLGLVKKPQIVAYLPSTILYPPLVVQWASKGNIAQRRGRVGRVQQGFYFSMLTKDFIATLPDYNAPPMQHTRIDELALHSLQLVAHPMAIFSICHGQPLVESIVSSMATLTSLGCILPKNDSRCASNAVEETFSNSEWSPLILSEARAAVNEGSSITEYAATFIGRLLQLIPVSAQQGILVFYGFLTGLESLMILAAAVTQSLPPFNVTAIEQQARSRHRRGGGAMQADLYVASMEAAERTMREFSLGQTSDIIAMIYAVLEFRVEHKACLGDVERLRHWCRDNQVAYDRVTAIVELEQHIKYELAGFVPFRDVEDPKVLMEQLRPVAPVLITLCSVAFAAQALEVTSQGSLSGVTKEGAVGLFTDLKALPDLNSPSCLRWEVGDIIVPITVALRHTYMLVSFATAVKSRRRFLLGLLLFAYRVRYAAMQDDKGLYYSFAIKYSGVTRYVEADAAAGRAIMDFRARLCRLCGSLRLRYRHKDVGESDFDEHMLKARGLAPFATQQREVIALLLNDFYGEAFDRLDVSEVDNVDTELDGDSILSFDLSQFPEPAEGTLPATLAPVQASQENIVGDPDLGA